MDNTSDVFTTIVTISRISEAVPVGAKGTLKQTFVGKTQGEWPNTFEFEAFGKFREKLEGFKEGDVVEVIAEPRGRAWTSHKDGKERIFMSLSMTDIRPLSASRPSTSTEADSSPVEAISVNDVDDSDIPF